jgi:signal peptidase I
MNDMNNNEELVKEEPQTEEAQNKVWNQVKEYAVSILVALVIAFTLRTYVFARANVEGISMVSTLQDKDIIFVEKLSLLTQNIKRGHIVIFDSNNPPGDVYVKRVIAIEGDEIEIKEGKVILNGGILQEDYLDSDTYTETGEFLSRHGKYTVEKGYVFVLGDNRAHSKDSRIIGPVKVKDIKGHTIFRVYPFKSMRKF